MVEYSGCGTTTAAATRGHTVSFSEFLSGIYIILVKIKVFIKKN